MVCWCVYTALVMMINNNSMTIHHRPSESSVYLARGRFERRARVAYGQYQPPAQQARLRHQPCLPMAPLMASLDRGQGVPKAAGPFRLSGGLSGGIRRKKSNKTGRGKGKGDDHSILHCFISCPLVMFRGGVGAVGFHGLRRHGNKTPRSMVFTGEAGGELEWASCRSSGGEPSLTPDPS